MIPPSPAQWACESPKTELLGNMIREHDWGFKNQLSDDIIENSHMFNLIVFLVNETATVSPLTPSSYRKTNMSLFIKLLEFKYIII